MSDTRVVTPDLVRFSYVHVFEPTSIKGGDEKYSVSIIIPKTAVKTIKLIKAAIKTAAKEGLNTKFSGRMPKPLKHPLRDGDVEKDDDPAYENCYFISANSKHRPGILDARHKPITDPDQFYSGCWGKAAVNFYAFEASGNKGIACGLGNLLKKKDGEQLGGGRVSAFVDFADDIPDDADFDEDYDEDDDLI